MSYIGMNLYELFSIIVDRLGGSVLIKVFIFLDIDVREASVTRLASIKGSSFIPDLSSHIFLKKNCVV